MTGVRANNKSNKDSEELYIF